MVLFGQTKQAASARTSLIYLTTGALTIVWTAIWWIYLRNNGAHENTYLWAYGFMATGVVLVLIGSGVGAIGRSAMAAETAPTAGVTGVASAAAIPPVGGVAQNATAPAGVPGPGAGGLPQAGTGYQAANQNTVPAAPVAPAQARRV